MAALMAASSPGNPGAAEPKGALNHFCQRFCRRPVTKEDIVYTSQKYGRVYQATVTLNCMEGQQFVGETSELQKDAEKNAAQQALMHFEPLADTLPPATSANKNKKRKPDGMPGDAVVKYAKGPDGAPLALPGAPGGENPALTAKVILNTVCMKVLKRPMQKGEVQYETVQTPVGYQSTVRLPCLPGELGQLTWAGEVSMQQKQAEHNAAKQALEAINAQAGQLGIGAIPQPGSAPEPKPPKTSGWKGRGKGWGGGWGGGGWGLGGWDWGMPWALGIQGCHKGGKGGGKQPAGKQPRSRITEVAVTGEVLEWKGTFGWLKPHVEIQHEKAKLRGGKIFLHGGDLQGELKSVEVGAVLQFHIYEDPSGLGAEEAQPF